MSGINPRVDIAFKKIFGVEENKDLLISLVNSIVSKEDQVRDLTLLNPYNPCHFRGDKLSILDIKAEGHDGKRFNIELQISDAADYDKRALYYWGKLYTEQLQQSEDYSQLAKAIGIHILNFISIPESHHYHNVFHITEKTNGFIYFKDLELHTIELKKFPAPEGEPHFIHRIQNSLDMWVAFLIRHDLLTPTSLPPSLDRLDLKKALSVLEVMNFGQDERDAYEAHLKWLRLESCTLRKYEGKGFDKGLKEGLVKGLEKGLEEGKKEGLKEGRKEGLEEGRNEEKREMARVMVKEGSPIEFIQKVTGLSLDVIQSLQ